MSEVPLYTLRGHADGPSTRRVVTRTGHIYALQEGVQRPEEPKARLICSFRDRSACFEGEALQGRGHS